MIHPQEEQVSRGGSSFPCCTSLKRDMSTLESWPPLLLPLPLPEPDDDRARSGGRGRSSCCSRRRRGSARGSMGGRRWKVYECVCVLSVVVSCAYGREGGIEIGWIETDR